jgi:non-ribosomal peptide synthetase component F
MVGLFINTLPVRVQVTPDDRLLSWLQAVQERQSEASQFEYSPLVQVQAWSDMPPRQPLFDNILVFENYPWDPTTLVQIPNLHLRQMRWVSKTTYPLTVTVLPGDELELRFTYACRDFNTATICRMTAHLRTLLEGIAASPESRLVELPLLTAEERDQLLRVWNDTRREYPQEVYIHHLVAAQVEMPWPSCLKTMS